MKGELVLSGRLLQNTDRASLYLYHHMYGFLFFFLMVLSIYLFLAALGLNCYVGFSLVVAKRKLLWLQCMGFSLKWLLSLWSMGSRAHGSAVVAPGL